MAAHTYWRLYIGAMPNVYAQIGTVSFLNAAQVNQSTGGTATASSEYNSSWAAGNAFDGNPTSEWASAGVSSSEWIAYQHPSPVDIVFVGVKVSDSYPVSGLALQYSDDGVSWSAASPLYVLAGQPALTTGSYTVLGLSASRRPLVVVDGRIKELPAGDTLPPQAPAEHTHPATSITNTPAGGIASTNVQAAINELDSEKANAASVREKLTAARTYYVRTDGSDSNSGMANTAGGAFLTIQKAVDVCAALDFNGFSATVQVGDGTWTAPATVSSTVNGTLTIAGNATTPDNVLWSLSSGSCLTASGPGVRVVVKDMKLQTGGVSGVVSSGRASATATNCTFGACGYSHVTGAAGGAIVISTSCRIVGSAPSFANLDNANIDMTLCAFTLTGTPAFSTAFITAQALSYARCVLPTFSGAATGSRYSVSTNSAINVNAAGETFLPGNAAGTKTTGGEYQ